MKKITFSITALFLTIFVNAQVGVNTTDPKTALDVVGAITNREVSFTVASNAVNINTETSLAKITGAATATVAVTSYVPLVNGHRLIISNNTSGGFGATFAGVTIPNNQAIEFIYTGGAWKTTIGGNASSTNIYNADGTLTGTRVVSQGANNLSFTGTGNTIFNTGKIGVGTTTPMGKLNVSGGLVVGSGANLANTSGVPFAYGSANDSAIWFGNFDNTSATDYGVMFLQSTLTDVSTLNILTGDNATGGSGDDSILIGNVDVSGIKKGLTIKNGFAGIGTTNPTAQFHTTGTVRFSGAGTALLGRSLVSDAAGNATWQNPLASNSTSTAITASATQVAVPSTNVQGAISDLATAVKSVSLNDWKLDGNSNGAIKKFGTIDAFDVPFITSNTERMRILANGNVGIGTSTPTKRLTVENGSIRPAIGNTQDAGISFPTDIGGGGGDEAFIRYYAETGENTKLSIGVNNDADDDISFFQAGAERMNIYNGNIGIGTVTPTAQLHTTGSVLFAGAGTPTLGRSLVTDATGLATWQNPLASNSTSTAITASATQVAVPSTNVQGAINDLATAVKAAQNSTIYTSDGSLTGNRIVTQNANTLAFTSTATNGFSVDGTTFSVDGANNRIGIGTAAPTAQFHTTGTVRFSGAGSALLGRSLVTDASGNATWQNPLASNSTSTAIAASATQVAVPSTNVQGAISDLATAVKSVSLNDWKLDGNSNGAIKKFGTIDAFDVPFITSNTERMRITNTGNVGIGTSTPTTTLDVGGNFKIYGNAIGDFSGAELRPHVNTGSFTVYTGVVGSGTPRFTVTNAGSVGIGTLTPSAQFHTTGTVRFSGAGTALLGRSLVTDAAGNATWQNPLASNSTSTAITASATQVAVPSTNVQGAISDLATAIKTTQNSTIYTADGTLTANRTVTQGTNTLAFNSTAVNGFNVDGNTFSIDTSNDRVGIGNVAPNLSLDVTAASGNAIGIKPSNVSQWDHLFLSCDGSSSYVTAGGAETGLQFRVGSGSVGTYGGQPYTTTMTMMPSGNVGIGTATPATKLDVAAGTTSTNTIVNATGNINDFLQFNVQNTSTGTKAQSGYSATADNGSSTTGFAWMGINNSTFNYPTAYNIGLANDVSFVGSGQDLYLANANNTKSIIFSTGKSTTPFFNERMRITNAGNVGIGTSTPSQILDVNGVSQFRNGNSSASFTNNQFLFGYAGTDTYRHAIKTRHNAGGLSGNSIDFYVWNQSTDAVATIGTKQVMTLDGNGNVGVGTTAPANKLEITQGTAGNSGLRLTNLTSSSTVTTPAPSGKILTVNTNGDVILVSLTDMLKAEKAANTQFGASGSNINVGTMSYENYDGNWSNNLVLPASAPYIGFELSIYCGSTFSTLITTTNTDMASSVTITTGNTKHFKWGGAKWQLLN